MAFLIILALAWYIWSQVSPHTTYIGYVFLPITWLAKLIRCLVEQGVSWTTGIQVLQGFSIDYTCIDNMFRDMPIQWWVATKAWVNCSTLIPAIKNAVSGVAHGLTTNISFGEDLQSASSWLEVKNVVLDYIGHYQLVLNNSSEVTIAQGWASVYDFLSNVSASSADFLYNQL